MDKQTLLQLLSNNQLDQLFESLKTTHPRHGDVVLLESQWNDIRSKQRNGLLSNEQASLETSRLRKSLLDLIEFPSHSPGSASYPPATQISSNKMGRIGSIVGVLLLAVGIYAYSNSGAENSVLPTKEPSTSSKSSSVSPAKTLNTSGAGPLTFSPGNVQYERVYTLVSNSVESTGGGKSLITLHVGLNFKGIINELLSTENFRLIADELPGPLAPTNFLSELVDSKSYGEGDIKFELSDDIKRFSVIIEGKEDKKWVFSR
jgi:hypothetical protein